MRYDKEAIENTEGKRWHSQEIHCRDGFTMIAQKCRPSFCRLGVPRGFPHPPKNCSLGKIETQHIQLAMNARRVPGWILRHHAEDEFAKLSADALPTRRNPVSREPRPI